jgi:hypothetical protein
MKERKKLVLTYLWHDGLSILTFDVPKWHFGALMLVNAEFRIIDVLDFLNMNYVA